MVSSQAQTSLLDLPTPLTDDECADFTSSDIGRKTLLSDFDIDASNYALIRHLCGNGLTEEQVLDCLRCSGYLGNHNVALHNFLLLINETQHYLKIDELHMPLFDALGGLYSADTDKKLTITKISTVSELKGAAATLRVLYSDAAYETIVWYTEEGPLEITNVGIRRVIQSRPGDTDKIIAYFKERKPVWDNEAEHAEYLLEYLDSGTVSAVTSGWL